MALQVSNEKMPSRKSPGEKTQGTCVSSLEPSFLHQTTIQGLIKRGKFYFKKVVPHSKFSKQKVKRVI